MLFGIEYNSWSIDGQLNFDFDKILTGEFCLDRTTKVSAEFKRKNSLPDLFKVPVLIISFLALSWIYIEYFIENFEIGSDLADLFLTALIAMSVMCGAWLFIGVPRLFYRFPTKLILRETEIYFENVWGGKVFIISKPEGNSVNQISESGKTIYTITNLKNESIFLYPENANENDILINYFASVGADCNFDLYNVPIIDKKYNCVPKSPIKYWIYIFIIIALISLGDYLNTQTDKNEFIVHFGSTEFLEAPLNNYKAYVNSTLQNKEKKLDKRDVFEGKHVNLFNKKILRKDIDIALRDYYANINAINSFEFNTINWKGVRRMTVGVTVVVIYSNNGELVSRKEYFELGETGKIVSVMDFDNQLQE